MSDKSCSRENGFRVDCIKLYGDVMAENARLKAEVDELRLENRAFKRTVNEASVHYDNRLDEIKRLKAEVERLRKAGDAVSLCLEAFWKGKPYDTSTNIKCFDAWNAAKEGKQS